MRASCSRRRSRASSVGAKLPAQPHLERLLPHRRSPVIGQMAHATLLIFCTMIE